MTLDEARLQIQNRIEGVVRAMQVGNGNPIFLPDGRPVQGVKAPPVGDLLALLLQAAHLEFQYLNVLGGMLSGGFTLSDAEAARVADLVVERIKAAVPSSEEKPES